MLFLTLDEKATNIVKLIRGSVVRIWGLIDNVLDLARARFGGGVVLELDDEEPLKPHWFRSSMNWLQFGPAMSSRRISTSRIR